MLEIFTVFENLLLFERWEQMSCFVYIYEYIMLYILRCEEIKYN